MDPQDSLAEEKAAQRKLVLQRRDSLPGEKREKDSLAVCRRIAGMEVFRTAGTILLFRAFGSEIDLSFLAQQAQQEGKTLLFPYCSGPGSMLALQPGRAWAKDRAGVMAPVPGEARMADPETIDLILCPCAGFDDRGHRLGMGGGYYDRFLPRCTRAFRLLAAFEIQRLDRVITGRLDVPMDGIATEERLLLYPAG